jgi:hypothetical protein
MPRLRQPPSPEEVLTMSAADFRQACSDLAIREMARHHARWDEIETRRALNRFAPRPRPDERLKQLNAKLEELKTQPQDDPDVARKVAALEVIKRSLA